MFDYYAALGASEDLGHISLNGFTQFINDCQLSSNKSEFCKKVLSLARLVPTIPESRFLRKRRGMCLSCVLRDALISVGVARRRVRDIFDQLFISADSSNSGED